jgi:hypothetical protein
LKYFFFCKRLVLLYKKPSLKLKFKSKAILFKSNFITTMSSFSNNNNNNNSIVYRSKLFRSAEQQQKQDQRQSTTNAKPVYKTFCKVCQDAGKSEQEYTNHSVRDKSGKTVCPTLLSQECRNCRKNGHTVKYCTLLKAPLEPVRAEIVKPKPVAAAKPNNVFTILESESEGEEEEKVVMPMRIAPCLPDLFPALTTAPANQRPVFSYGKIIQQVNDPETYAKAKKEEMLLKAEVERQAREERMKKTKVTKTSWADAESSDEEDDEEDEPYRVEVVDNSAW